MQIRINPKYNEKLLENYPDDPYSNLCIITHTRRLNLQLAYLSIDSTFFANIDPDTREVNLSHISEEPLLRVIRSLYGEKLIANTIGELSELYQVIRELEVDDYKANIEKEILTKPYIMESLEFLEFSFANDLLVDQVIDKHIENRLKLLQSNRNYLQLNKITVNTFQTLVEKFIEKMIESYQSIENLLTKPQAQIVNHVMENYFNRNNIKAGNYFKQQTNNKCADMEMIWSKYHHTFAFNNNGGNSSTTGESKQFGLSMGNLSSMSAGNMSTQFLSVKNLQQEKTRKKSEEIINTNTLNISPTKSPRSPTSSTSEMEKKKQRVDELESQIRERDEIIAQLQRQISQVKQSYDKQPLQKITRRTSGSNTTNQTVPQVIDQEEFMKDSTEQESLSFLPNIKKARKSKDYEEEDDFAASSVFQPAFNANNRKLPEMKEVRTMKKVTGGVKNKFLPH